MKIQFKKQKYQTEAVKAVVDCFAGQPNKNGIKYQIDPGVSKNAQETIDFEDYRTGFKNEDIVVNVLENIKKVQQRQWKLHISQKLIKNKSPCEHNLDVEMETGTGKTYVYIKTMYELHKSYGWSKFIIVVPSVAIREGIGKSFEITQDHFQEDYGKKIRWFIYDSNDLGKIDEFSSDGNINVMIINYQAFNAAPKKDASQKIINNQKNKIYRKLDDFNTRRPIDVIRANKPILILDEPQKIEGTEKKSTKASEQLKEFDPLFCLRYSATHSINYNKIHMLDAVDAYNEKLVKKINVRAITKKGMGGIDAHLNLKLIQVSKGKNPTAKIEIDRKLGSGISSHDCTINHGDNLFDTSNEVEAYRDGYVVTEIDARTDTVTFANGVVIEAGKPNGEVDDKILRRIQIRETVRAHFEKERELFSQGIKVLSLFFIDSVKKYRDYDAEDNKGEYARIFEEEYNRCLNDNKESFNEKYQEYLGGIETDKTHNGYFSIDKDKKMVDSNSNSKKELSESTDTSAYDLILKHKEKLLLFNEPTRFIFSHSALREGWDNPNIFVICTLKHTDIEDLRRQEVGRGLRLAVDQNGVRQDNPATVHHTNVLTVIANESYQSFVSAFQKEIVDKLSHRPGVANEEYFENKPIQTDSDETIYIDSKMATSIHRYLVKNEYVDDEDRITEQYHKDKKDESLALLPEKLISYKNQIFNLVDSVSSENAFPSIDNDRMTRTNKLNKENFFKKEFQNLWNKINTKGIFQVSFDSEKLINNSVLSINEKLQVNKVRVFIEGGTQKSSISEEQLKQQESFKINQIEYETLEESVHSPVPFDLINKIAEKVYLTRNTVAYILKKINPIKFDLFKENPEEFINNISKLIEEEKSKIVIPDLRYSLINEKYDNALFTSNVEKINLEDSQNKLNKHVFDYVKIDKDSKVERKFVEQLEADPRVIVYSKLPRGFSIPTPEGRYNPDWAIVFNQNHNKHIYYIVETKGSMRSSDLRGIEGNKVDCAKKFFEELNKAVDHDFVNYDVVDSYESLMKIVS